MYPMTPTKALLASLRCEGLPWTDRRHEDPGPHLGDAGEDGAFSTDRQRVLTCNAFRRLQYKTQVFVTGAGDHFRTRLTHTLEVALISRRLCHRLGLNGDLAETVALAHDLGHPPFGHAGERTLDLYARAHGLPGFEHNAQSLRVVDYLEHPYPPFRGLNLTRVVRDCLAGHTSPFDQPQKSVENGAQNAETQKGQLCLEGQVVNLADQIAYLVHDLEDAWLMEMVKTVPVWPPLKSWAEILPVSWREDAKTNIRVRRPVCEAWQNQLLSDVVAETNRVIRATGVQTVAEVECRPDPLVRFSPPMQSAVDAWRKFNLERIYKHPSVVQREERCKTMLNHLAEVYTRNPERMPTRYVTRIAEQGVCPVVMDYLAGMTDRFAQECFEKL